MKNQRQDLPVINNLRAFEIKYLGATNTRGSRVSVKDLRFNKSIILSYNYEFDNTYEIAQAFFIDKGIEILHKAEGKECYIMLSNNFQTQIK